MFVNLRKGGKMSDNEKYILDLIRSDEDLKGTLLQDLFEVMDSGDFIEPENPVTEEETVIGEMTGLEKALYTLVETRNKPFSEHCAHGCEECPPEKIFEIHGEREFLQNLINIMWHSIKGRIPAAKKASAIGVRKDFAVVAMPEPEDTTLELAILLGIG